MLKWDSRILGIFCFFIFLQCLCVRGRGRLKLSVDLSQRMLTLCLSLPLPLVQTHYTVPDTEKDLESLYAAIECEQPQPDLYKQALMMVPQQVYTTSMHCLWFVGRWINSMPVENVLSNCNINMSIVKWRCFGKPTCIIGWFYFRNSESMPGMLKVVLLS